MMEEAAAHMDRVVIIDHGTIIANDTLEVLLEAHFGGTRTLRVTPATDPPPPGWTLQGGTMCRDLSGGDGIASWMRELEQQGADIQGIRIDTPTLQDVFLHLTGRELRE
jgi:ABC-2 type transport system ATP-binding protein